MRERERGCDREKERERQREGPQDTCGIIETPAVGETMEDSSF